MKTSVISNPEKFPQKETCLSSKSSQEAKKAQRFDKQGLSLIFTCGKSRENAPRTVDYQKKKKGFGPIAFLMYHLFFYKSNLISLH